MTTKIDAAIADPDAKVRNAIRALMVKEALSQREYLADLVNSKARIEK